MKLNLRHFEKPFRKIYTFSKLELCGFILPNGAIKEVFNNHPSPAYGFDMSSEDILEHTEKLGAVATWHTHPDAPANLSGEDYLTFMSWPNLYHIIVGEDCMKAYQYSKEVDALVEVSLDDTYICS